MVFKSRIVFCVIPSGVRTERTSSLRGEGVGSEGDAVERKLSEEDATKVHHLLKSQVGSRISRVLVGVSVPLWNVDEGLRSRA